MNASRLLKKMNGKPLTQRLNKSEWANHHNVSQVGEVVQNLRSGFLSVQSQEIIKLIPAHASVLEIGSGSGQSSLNLAMNGIKATVLDYEQQCLDLTLAAAKELDVDITAVLADAEKPLPFKEDQFDYIFHAGLLEHYSAEERVALLKTWRPYSKIMISMVPNAASIAYRTGKSIMERNGTWEYGIENPLYSAKDEFINAGYDVLSEYTIGELHSLNFLPRYHYLRPVLKYWMNHNPCSDNCGQGYLLVTVGRKV